MSRSPRFGLALLALLSLADLSTPFVTDGETPPMSVALIVAALGAASLVLVALVWRGAHRLTWPLLVLRILSAAAALPAFFVSDVPAAARLGAGAVVVLTLVGVALSVPAARTSSVAGVR